MYTDHYGLTGRPFQLSPNPQFFYPSRAHRRAVANFSFGLQQGEGFIVLTGEIGAGKTTLIGYLEAQLSHQRLSIVPIGTVSVEAEEVPRLVARALRLDPDRVQPRDVLGLIERDLRRRDAEHQRVLLVVDEAQNLSTEALKILCRLSSLVEQGRPILQILVAGTPSFRALLAGPALERLRQRVVASAHLGPLEADEVQPYMEHRLRRVGWRGDPAFEPGVFDEIYTFSRGLPRLVNLIAARLLVHGAIEQRSTLTAAEARELAQELRLEQASSTEEAGAPFAAEALRPTPTAPAGSSGGKPTAAVGTMTTPALDTPAGDPLREIERLRLKLEEVYTELSQERRRVEEQRAQIDRLVKALHQNELDQLRADAAISRRLADILAAAGAHGMDEAARKAGLLSMH